MASSEKVGPGSGAQKELLKGAREGDLAKMSLAISGGADVNAADQSGRTPLMEALWGRDLKAVKKLLALGADPNARSKRDGLTPLTLACDQGCGGRAPMAKALLEAGADPDRRDGNKAYPLMAGVWSVGITKALLSHGASIGKVSKDACPMWWALIKGSSDSMLAMAAALTPKDLERGAGVDAMCYLAGMPRDAKREPCMRALIEAGVSPMRPSIHAAKMRALEHAVRRGFAWMDLMMESKALGRESVAPLEAMVERWRADGTANIDRRGFKALGEALWQIRSWVVAGDLSEAALEGSAKAKSGRPGL